MYLTWPISLAAKAQLLSIKNPIQNIDPNSTSPTSEGSLCTSLRVLESVLKSLKVATTYSNETLEEIRLALENKEDVPIHPPIRPIDQWVDPLANGTVPCTFSDYFNIQLI